MEEKIAAVVRLYDEIGIASLCIDKINTYYKEGLSILDSIQLPAERKEVLRGFVCGMMNREV